MTDGERYYRFCRTHRVPFLTAAHYNLDNLSYLGRPYVTEDGITLLLPNGYVRDPHAWEVAKLATYKNFAVSL